MAQPSHIYGVARIHALELKLLDNAKIERMVDAATPEEVLKVLAESGDYGASMGDIQGPWEYERLLADEKKRLVDLMEQLSPDPDLTDLFFIRNDIHNLKVLLKAHYLGRNYDEFLSGAGRIETDRLKAALEEDAHRQLPAWLADAVEQVHLVSAESADPQRIEVILDRAMYRHILEVCRKNRQKFLLDFFREEIDLINIKSFFRVFKGDMESGFFSRVFIPGGYVEEKDFWKAFEEGMERLPEILYSTDYSDLVQETVTELSDGHNLSNFEKKVDNRLLARIKSASRYNFDGIEPVIGYIFAKEYEAKVVRIIMVGKLNGLEPGSIRERLRDSYV